MRSRNGQTPVQHKHFTELTQHNVFGLKIAIDHALMMSVRNCVAHLVKDVQIFLQRHFPDAFVPRNPVNSLHHIIRQTVGGLSQFVDRNNIGMHEVGSDQCLGKKHLSFLPVGSGHRFRAVGSADRSTE